jgi:hypothetical protein
MGPQGHLQDHRLPQGIVLAIDDFRRVPLPCQEGFHGHDDGGAESDEIPSADVA